MAPLSGPGWQGVIAVGKVNGLGRVAMEVLECKFGGGRWAVKGLDVLRGL